MSVLMVDILDLHVFFFSFIFFHSGLTTLKETQELVALAGVLTTEGKNHLQNVCCGKCDCCSCACSSFARAI